MAQSASMTNSQSLVVSSDLAELPRVIDFVRQACLDARLSSDDMFACELATDEACTNIMEHAYLGSADGQIRVTCRYAGNLFVVELHDHGRPFDPSLVEPPQLTGDLDMRDVGGLGLYFMRHMMDEVRFEFDRVTGNTLTMTKRVAPRQAEAEAMA